MIRIICLLLTACLTPPSVQSTEIQPTNAERILILGDSITHAGHYVVDLELALRTASAGKESPEIINLGLPSETCSGLSEEGHPFPRPDVHTRLDAALKRIKPDLVIACYGMNDGIYHPLSEERFAAYKAGVRKLVLKVQSSGAKIVLLTPPPFDPVPLQGKPGKLLPSGSTGYGWKGVSDSYDKVIQTYADWILKNDVAADDVIDIHTPLTKALADGRKADADFRFAGDGIHLNADGHRIIANSILRHWDIDPADNTNPEAVKTIRQRERLLHDAWLTEVGHERPGMKEGLPITDALKKASELDTLYNRLVKSN